MSSFNHRFHTSMIVVLFFATAVFGQNSFSSYEQSIPGSAVAFKMIAVSQGSFLMGSPDHDLNKEADERPQRRVEVSAFWIEEHEVTFAEWDAFFKDVTIPQGKNVDGITRPTPQYIDLTWGMGREAQHPTNSMSQQAAIMYCQWLYAKTGFFYRLPTEAEWEYACQAGRENTYPVKTDPSSLSESGFFRENSQGKFHKVKQKKPNAWQLYDMLGNLSEWTLDQYEAGAYTKMAAVDPLALPVSKYPRTTRGGSYLDESNQLRCTNRIPSNAKWNQRDPQIPKSRWWLTDAMYVGFRVVRPFKQPSKEDIEKFYAQYLK